MTYCYGSYGTVMELSYGKVKIVLALKKINKKDILSFLFFLFFRKT